MYLQDYTLQAEKSREAEVGFILARTVFKLTNDKFCSLGSPDESPSFNPRRNPYPNPGYLGSSSHAAIFKHITPEGDHVPGSQHAVPEALSSDLFGDNHLVLQGADILKHLLTEYKLSAMKDLITFWLAKGANLALAEPFVDECAQNVSQLFTYHDENWHLVYARRLLHNSAQPLHFNDTSDLASFSAQFLDHNSRWETLGIFFAAVTRATIDIPFFPSLYTTEQGQYTLRRLCTKLCDFALEISLSLDCLNDLQLIMQYENFIVHSYVDGDQSKLISRLINHCLSNHILTLQRLSFLAQARRCNIIYLRFGLPRKHRSKTRHPAIPQRATQNSLRPYILRRQEHSDIPRPPTTNEQTLLPLPNPILPRRRSLRVDRRCRSRVPG